MYAFFKYEYKEEGKWMKFIDRLKNSLKKSEKDPSSVLPESYQVTPESHHDSIENLWFALCDNPNLEEKLPELIVVCRIKGGPAAVYAALEELSRMDGSWLPQVYLGRHFLEQKDYDQAHIWYTGVLGAKPTGYVLLLISSDLGRFGFAAQMPELIMPYYDPDRHDVYIGLNLLQAFSEIPDPEAGLVLARKLRKYEQPDIQEYLNNFTQTFMQQRNELVSIGTEPAVPDVSDEMIVPSTASIPNAPEDETVPVITPAITTAIRSPRATQVAVPIWSCDFFDLEELLPKTVDRKRVGVYMYADTSSGDTPSVLPEDWVAPYDLAVSLPLFIGERLLFTTNYVPVALYPVSRDKGPEAEGLEPDVQSLFALCTKEALDFIVTGTVFLDGNVYRVRSWILDKAKQSARIVAKDLPAGHIGEPFNDMINDIMLLFFDRRFVKPAGRSEFPYEVPPPELMVPYLQALSFLLYQNLVQKKICDEKILPDLKNMLDRYAYLTHTDPKNQMYLMMLLQGMKNVRRMGSEEYLNYRQLLFENAEKNRFSPCVKATIQVMNELLKDL